MGTIDTFFAEDIVLDEAAFDRAATGFAELGEQLEQLRADLESMMNTLKAGFDTPAGRRFLGSCEENLFAPLNAQRIVLTHISEALAASRQSYESVFREYESLQTQINQANH